MSKPIALVTGGSRGIAGSRGHGTRDIHPGGREDACGHGGRRMEAVNHAHQIRNSVAVLVHAMTLMHSIIIIQLFVKMKV